MADPFRRARVTMALGTGFRVTAVVTVLTAMFVFLAVFTVGNVSGDLMGGRLGDPDPVQWTAYGAGAVGVLGTVLTALSAVKARNPVRPAVHSIGGHVEIRHWRDHPAASGE